MSGVLVDSAIAFQFHPFSRIARRSLTTYTGLQSDVSRFLDLIKRGVS